MAVPGAAVDPVWPTRQPERTVLGVVHNVTCATRLFDVLPLLATDHRIEVIFACTESSPFAMDVDPHLDSRRVRRVEWPELAERQVHLTISTSHGGPLHELNSPIIILPHGMGYNKYLKPGNPETRKPGNPETRKPGIRSGTRVVAVGGRADRLITGVLARRAGRAAETLLSGCVGRGRCRRGPVLRSDARECAAASHLS